MQGLSLVAASEGRSSSRCAGLSLSRPLLLRSTGSRRAGSVVVTHGPSCSAACGIFPDQGSNPCPLHWQADSQPLHHQGSPVLHLCTYTCIHTPILQNFLSIMFYGRGNRSQKSCLSQPFEAILQSAEFMVLLLHMLEISPAWTSLCLHS